MPAWRWHELHPKPRAEDIAARRAHLREAVCRSLAAGRPPRPAWIGELWFWATSNVVEKRDILAGR